jgi:hypothetical protein
MVFGPFPTQDVAAYASASSIGVGAASLAGLTMRREEQRSLLRAFLIVSVLPVQHDLSRFLGSVNAFADNYPHVPRFSVSTPPQASAIRLYVYFRMLSTGLWRNSLWYQAFGGMSQENEENEENEVNAGLGWWLQGLRVGS